MQRSDSRRKLAHLARVPALLFLMLATLRCGLEGPPEHGAAPTPGQAQLALSPSNPQLAQGIAQQFTLRSLQADGHDRDLTAKVKWSVVGADGSVASSSSDGLLAIAKPGRYRVMAEYEGSRVETPVIVTDAALTSIAVSPSLPKVAKGLTQQFKATATFSDGTTQDVTAMSAWSIKDTVGTGVAVVNTLGLVTTKNVGKARITAKLMTKSSSTTLEVTAAALKTLTLSPLDPSAAKGTSQRFTATGSFTDGTVQDVTASADWSVMDVVGSGVASIDGTGTAVGEQVGQAKVSAEYLGQVAETTFTVTAAAPVSLSISPASASIAQGTTQQYTATAKLTDGSSQDVSAAAAWTSTDLTGMGVAAVDAKGLAKGNAVGTAAIVCSYRGYNAAATLEVKPAALTSIVIAPGTASAAKGRSQSFSLIGTYTDGSTQDLSGVAVWSVSDLMGTDVASLSATGSAFAKNVGQAQIKAEHMGKSATATFTVTAAVLTSFTLSPNGAAVAIGATQQFKAIGTYSDGTTQDHSAAASFSVTDIAPAMGVATISATGLATGKTKGLCTVAATYLGSRAQATLSVGMPRGICSADGWCWRNPLPQGNYLPSVWAKDASNAWAVSDFGVILKWNGSSWDAQPSGTTQNLLGVWGTDVNNVWAVGVGGTIVKWNGSTWAVQTSGTTQNLSGVWGTDASNVWAVGASGVIVKWNGTSWTAQASGTTQYLRGIWGSSASNVYVVGASGTILKWDGMTWSLQASGTLQYLRGIWGTDANNIWTVGLAGTILKWDGTSWAAQTSATTVYLRSVWGSDAKNVWATGDYGTVLKWDGAAWTAQTSGTSQTLNGLWGTAANSVWAVGNNGVILLWDGTTWTAKSSGSLQSAFGVWGSDANNIWAVGEAGSIRKWNGSVWSAQTSGATESLSAIWGSDANNIWAVGGGTIVKWNGSTWSVQLTGLPETLSAVWGSDANNVWAVGYSGVIRKWNGTMWTTQTSGTLNTLYAVWGTDANNVWAVGYGGTVLRWNGTAWSAVASATVSSLLSIWGTDANNIWAAGATGTIVKWNGTAWSAQVSATTQTLFGLWGSDANNIYGVGYAGTIVKWNGTAWATQASGSSQGFNAVWGTDARNVWAVGNQGTILQRVP